MGRLILNISATFCVLCLWLPSFGDAPLPMCEDGKANLGQQHYFLPINEDQVQLFIHQVHIVNDEYALVCLPPQATLQLDGREVLIEHSLSQTVIVDTLHLPPTASGIVVKSPTILRGLELIGTDAIDSIGLRIENAEVEIHNATISGFDVGVLVAANDTLVSESHISGFSSDKAATSSSRIGVAVSASGFVSRSNQIDKFHSAYQFTNSQPKELSGGSIAHGQRGISYQTTAAMPMAETTDFRVGSYSHIQQFSEVVGLEYKGAVVAKLCTALTDAGHCDTIHDEVRVSHMIGTLPSDLCAGSNASAGLSLYYRDDSEVDAAFTYAGQCAPELLAEAVTVLADSGTVSVAAGSCVYRCEQDADGNTLALNLNADVQIVGPNANGLMHEYYESPLEIYDLPDIKKTETFLGPLAEIQLPTDAGFTSGGNANNASASGAGESVTVPVFETTILPSEQEVADKTPNSSIDSPLAPTTNDKPKSTPGIVAGCTLIPNS